MSAVRKLVTATTVAGLLLPAAACTGTKAEDEPRPGAGPSQTTSPADDPDPVKLRFSVFGEPDTLTAYEDLAAAFTKNHPNIEVTVDHTPNAKAAMADLERASAEGTAPDLFMTDQRDLPELIEAGRVQPVHALLGERQVDFGDGYQREGLEAFSASAALQCMPHDVSPLVVYYNQDLVDLKKVVDEGEEPLTAADGWTWEQFTAAARQASRKDVKGVHIEPSLEYLAPFIWSGGGELVDDSETPSSLAFADGDSKASLEQVLALVRDPQVTPTEEQLARKDAVGRFKSGQLAMILGTRELTPRLRDAKVRFDVLPLPSLGRYRTVLRMTGYCISSQTEHLQAAADFLAFAVGREGATITATPGYVVPSNLEVAYSPAFTQPGKAPASSFVFNEGVRRSGDVPFVEEWPAAERAVRPLLERLFYAPVIDLDAMLQRIDTVSQGALTTEETSPAG